jgi:uncharacterized iron-regulated membrane protein
MTTTPNQRRSTPPDIESTQEESRLPSPDRPARTRANGLTAVLVRLHFYAGLLIGPFLLIATLSGGLYAVAPSLEQLLYRSYLHAETTGPALPVAEQIRAAQQLHPDLTVTAIRPASEPGETTRVLFDDPTLGESLRRAVFIDPAAAQPQGDLVVYGSSSALPARTWISQLHRNLHLGEPGRIYSELAASWLWVIALGGLWLWVSRYRRMTARTSTGARLFTINREATGRSRTLGWHGAVGLWIAAGLIFLSATGLTWSTYAGANITALRAALSWTTPTVATALTDSGPVTAGAEDHDHSGHNSAAAQEDSDTAAARIDEVDRVLQSARDAGVGGKVEVNIPDEPDTAFTVAQTRQPWVMSNNAVAVDGATGEITDSSWFADWPVAAKLAAWGIQLHMGTLFGVANQIVLVALAIALLTVIIRGYVMWWRRRPTRGTGTFGRPPTRGSIRRVPIATSLAITIVAIVVGWFVPLLGISLLAFLVVDVAVGASRHRAGRPGLHHSSGREHQDLAPPT